MARAVRVVSRNPARFKEECVTRAKEFDVSVFIDRMREVINENHFHHSPKIVESNPKEITTN
jgi:hypothetical protein